MPMIFRQELTQEILKVLLEKEPLTLAELLAERDECEDYGDPAWPETPTFFALGDYPADITDIEDIFNSLKQKGYLNRATTRHRVKVTSSGRAYLLRLKIEEV